RRRPVSITLPCTTPFRSARGGAVAMLSSYTGRRTLHVLGNFLARATSETRVEAQYVVTVYELTREVGGVAEERPVPELFAFAHADRKSTRLNSSHVNISY